MTRRRLLKAVALGTLLAAVAVAPLVGRTLGPVVRQCPPCQRLANAFVRTDISPTGNWVLGTTGGDPDTPLDNDKALLYGFDPMGNSTVGSGYTTVRVVGPAGTVDRVPPDALRQIAHDGDVVSVWAGPAPYSVLVTETVRLVDNAFSGRADAAEVRYELHNRDRVRLEVGVRALLDVKLGYNDGAPYFVPGVGAISHEIEFTGSTVPAFWVAFESPTYDPRLLRAVGMLQGSGLTTPDRFLIANWVQIQDHDWVYPIHPSTPVTRDSAVALYWEPRGLDPGQRRTLVTRYGEASPQGGMAFLAAPVEAECDTTVTVALFVSNFDAAPLTGGEATIQVVPGIGLANGEVATKAMGDIAPGGTGSVQWQLTINPQVRGDMTLQAHAIFGGSRRLDASTHLQVSCPVATPTPTVTPVPTSTQTPVATWTPSPTPTESATGTPLPTATAGPLAPYVCDFILNRVPAAIITRALANPHLVAGYGQLANPSIPPSPFNQPRRWLSLLNIALPYDPVNNTLVFKAGCP